MRVFNQLKSHKMPDQSLFYDRIIPASLVVLTLVMIGLVVFAIGILTGVIIWA